MTQTPYGEQYPPPPYNPVQGQYPPPPAPAGPPPPSGTNGFAIASLIFGIIGGVLFSVIFGIIALTQIKKRNQGGKGMAITGLALSGVWLAVICVGVVVAIIANTDDVKANTDPTTRPSKEVSVRVETLKTGDCVNDLQETDSLRKLPAINCAQPHQGEVVGEFNVTGSTFPGDTAIAKQAKDRCFEILDAYSPSTKDDQSIGLYYVHPTQASWNQGDRQVLCIAEHTDGLKTGSIKG